MKFTSEIIKKAWAIRKIAAENFSCTVIEISWKICLQMAKGDDMEDWEGTEKQIAWAKKIKAKKLEELEDEIKDYGIESIQETITDESELDLTTEEITEKIEKVKACNNATWWINNKNLQYAELAYLIIRIEDKLFNYVIK